MFRKPAIQDMSKDNYEIQRVSVDLIDDPRFPIRSNAGEEELWELADSIRDVGLIQPLLVKRRGERFEVIAGHRRLVASRLANVLTIPVIISIADNVECEAIKLHENLCREDVNFVDEARAIRNLMKLKKLTVDDASQMLKKSKTYIRDRLSVFRFPDDIIKAIDKNKICYTAAAWFAKIGDSVDRKNYLDLGIKQGISAPLARDWYIGWKRRMMPGEPYVCPQIKERDENIVEYYNEPCRICGQQIKMGDEQIIFVHPECLVDVEKK